MIKLADLLNEAQPLKSMLSYWSEQSVKGKDVTVSVGFFDKGMSYRPGDTGVVVSGPKRMSNGKLKTRVKMERTGKTVSTLAVHFILPE